MSKRDRRGISLFEAIAAVAIVGVVAVSALSTVGTQLRTATKSRQALEMAALATTRMDLLDLLSDRELQAIPDSVAKGKFDPPLDMYTWETAAASVSSEPGIYNVTITVARKDASYILHTYVYRRPLLVTGQ